jgi:hypothetical protein
MNYVKEHVNYLDTFRSLRLLNASFTPIFACGKNHKSGLSEC